ncbi:MAG: hypothetical protein ACJAYU_002607 [Bradymonadia bacterium]|jgi:hypothetical protein
MAKQMISGGCFCGTLRYEVLGGLANARSCHCSRCRKAFSGAGSAYAEIPPEATFRWTEGTDDLSTYETGPGWGMGFCGKCGSTLCGLHNGAVHGLALGCVDGDPGVKIEAHIFVDSRATWDHIGGTAPQHAGHASDEL